MFSGVTRNSRRILRNVTDNLDKVKPLLKTCDEAYDILMEGKYEKFLYLLGRSWHQKKLTSSIISENDTIREIDSTLEKNESVCDSDWYLSKSKKRDVSKVKDDLIDWDEAIDYTHC